MKVLYGIQGTGNGHLARARALAPELLAAGINVDFVFSGRQRKDFFYMALFGNEYRCFEGMTFYTEKGRIQKRKTFFNSKLVQLIKDIRSLQLTEYDLIINDFEPISAWAAKIQNKPCLGISHQCAFDHQVPKIKGNYLEKAIMRCFAPSQYRIGLHWHHFNQPILPPLIEQQSIKPIKKNKILVYMGFEALNDVISFVSGFSQYEFHVYAKVEQAEHREHVFIKPLSHSQFHQDLSDAAGVITNAGFELASECITLGKKLLVKPLIGQYEQICNALALQVLCRASVMDYLDQNILAKWLDIENHPPVHYPNVAQKITQWIQQGQFNEIKALSDSLWESTDIPFQLPSTIPNKVEQNRLY